MVDTPFVIIDESKMNSNIRKMNKVATDHNVELRPHIKTHKIPSIAHQQLKAGASGITVSKVTEAEVMAAHGITNIFIAYPIIGKTKINKVLRLNEKVSLMIGTDSFEGARRLSEAAKESNSILQVRLEIDTGLKRTGILYEQAVSLAEQLLHLPNIVFKGIYTFRGSVLNGQSTMDKETAGLEEGRLMVALADRMRSNGIAVEDVSVGSTPTAEYAAQVKGVTEIRPGTYIFYDAMQKALGCCSIEECAASVVTTIVSKPTNDLLTVDGGSKTFATDVQPNQHPLNLKGFGIIRGYPDATLERLSEEHGVISFKEEHDLEIGDKLTIIPNHICSTVNLHNQVYIKYQNNKTIKKDVEGRGKLQ